MFVLVAKIFTVNWSTQKSLLEASHIVPKGHEPTVSDGIVAPKQKAKVVREVQANTWFELHLPQLEVSPQLAGKVLRWKQILRKFVQTKPSGQVNNWALSGWVPKVFKNLKSFLKNLNKMVIKNLQNTSDKMLN